MTDDEWSTFAMLLDKGFKWREPFGAAHEFTYRTMLDGYEPEQIATVLRALVASGQVFGPTPGEIVAQIRNDPSRPTFEEAYQLIYGQGGILRARPPRNASFADAGEMARARGDAQKARAATVHPLVGSFALRYGLDRLADLEVNHETYGDVKRRDLRDAWDRHVEAMEGRDVAALASGRRGQLAEFDPLGVLGRGVPVQIGRGE